MIIEVNTEKSCCFAFNLNQNAGYTVFDIFIFSYILLMGEFM